ncbi:asparagine synthetase B family protein [Radicibacter daui]|uniref:asparagine synthetase B family protein n=1 Tax=Radicibacter daui TaxID=3064829 RepID=UPI004046FF67
MGDEEVLFIQQGAVDTPQSEFETWPLRVDGGRFLLCFDGRLDNRDDLARLLGLELSDTMPDSTLVSAAWTRWQEAALHRMLGDFALASWDSRRRELILACDAGTGGRPLYYHEMSGHIVFASNLALLLRTPGVPRDLDLPVIAASAHWQWPSDGRTWYRQIQQLPPAGRLRWSQAGSQVERYWRPDLSRRVRFARDCEYVEAARDLLDQAVAAHCRVAGPLVCELSGGLDSTAVAATAARLNPSRPVHCITVVPDGQARQLPETGRVFHDEWPHAEAVARLYPNIIPLRVEATAPTAADLDPVARFARLGSPVSNLYDRSWFEAGRQRVRGLGAGTVLAGTSGNLTLSHGGLRHLTDLARQGRWLSLFRHAGELGQWSGLQTTRLLRQAFRTAWWPDEGPGDLGPAVGELHRQLPLKPDNAGSRDLRERLLLFERLVEGRRMVSSFARHWQGIDLRDPLGYRPLLEFCLAIPPAQYLAQGMPRSLARRVLADRVPANVIGEARRGRQAPELSTTIWNNRQSLRAALDAMARSEAVSELLDISWLRATLDGLPSSASLIGQTDAISLRLAVAAMAMGQFVLWAEAGMPGLEITGNRAVP